MNRQREERCELFPPGRNVSLVRKKRATLFLCALKRSLSSRSMTDRDVAVVRKGNSRVLLAMVSLAISCFIKFSSKYYEKLERWLLGYVVEKSGQWRVIFTQSQIFKARSQRPNQCDLQSLPDVNFSTPHSTYCGELQDVTLIEWSMDCVELFLLGCGPLKADYNIRSDRIRNSFHRSISQPRTVHTMTS